MLLSRLARNYAARIADHWSEVDATLQRCFRAMDPALRLRAVRVRGLNVYFMCEHWSRKEYYVVVLLPALDFFFSF